ncbi:MAG: NUDIX hydrolase [Parachlamydiales bacterium]|nr:NUDIX hydrolase [Parachlamydiales bacterium]
MKNKAVFEEKPKNFKPDLISAACHIIFKNKILLLQKSKNRWGENKWGVPCGRIEKEENIFDAIKREIKEEIHWDISIKNLQYHNHVYIVHPDVQYIFHMFSFEPKNTQKVIISDEHSDHEWADIDKLDTFDLLPGQKEAFEIFFKKKSKDN